jgi:hypothetical protein
VCTAADSASGRIVLAAANPAAAVAEALRSALRVKFCICVEVSGE